LKPIKSEKQLAFERAHIGRIFVDQHGRVHAPEDERGGAKHQPKDDAPHRAVLNELQSVHFDLKVTCGIDCTTFYTGPRGLTHVLTIMSQVQSCDVGQIRGYLVKVKPSYLGALAWLTNVWLT
jgi:hypothetical protein